MRHVTRAIVWAAILIVGKAASACAPRILSYAEAIEKADFVGIVEVTETPEPPERGFSDGEVPTIVVTAEAVLKGTEDAKSMRVLRPCYLSEPHEVGCHPKVAERYMAFLVKKDKKHYVTLRNACSWARMAAAPNVSEEVVYEDWRIVYEVCPFISRAGERVQYRCYRTRLAPKPWQGMNSNAIASYLPVVDFTRRKLLAPKRAGVRSDKYEDVPKGRTVVSVTDLAEFFDISKPGEYWILCGRPLRFFVADDMIVRRDGLHEGVSPRGSPEADTP